MATKEYNVFYCYTEEYSPTYCGVKTVETYTPKDAIVMVMDLLAWDNIPPYPEKYSMLYAVEANGPVYTFGGTV